MGSGVICSTLCFISSIKYDQNPGFRNSQTQPSWAWPQKNNWEISYRGVYMSNVDQTSIIQNEILYNTVQYNTIQYSTVPYSDTSHTSIWVFPKIGVLPKHPKMVIFSRNTNSCWVPPFSETSIYAYMQTVSLCTWAYMYSIYWYIISWILYAYKINLQHLVSRKRTWLSAALLVMHPKLSSYLRYVHNKNAPKRDHYKFCLKTKALKCEPSCAVRSDTSRSKCWRARSIHQKPSSSIAVPIERRTADWARWRHASRKAPIPSCHWENIKKIWLEFCHPRTAWFLYTRYIHIWYWIISSDISPFLSPFSNLHFSS